MPADHEAQSQVKEEEAAAGVEAFRGTKERRIRIIRNRGSLPHARDKGHQHT